MSLPLITVQGVDFISEGKKFHYVGLSEFALFKRWLMHDGPNALVKPILDERRLVARASGYGDKPLVLRVFRYAAVWNPFYIEPWSYGFDEITNFTKFCNDNGYYVDWTCGDSQIVLSEQNGPKGQQEHLNKTAAALIPCGSNFLQTCNEPFKNGIDVSKVIPAKWGDYLTSSGAYGEYNETFPNPLGPFQAILDFVDYHPTRSEDKWYWPKFLYDLPVSAAVLLRALNVPVVFGEPMGFGTNEPERRSDNAIYANIMGSLIKWGVGVTFHSTIGAFSNGYDSKTRDCAEAFLAGAAGGVK